MRDNDNYPMGTWGGDPSAPWNQNPDEGYEESLEGDEPPVDELTNIQKLAIAQAFYKSVAELVKTGDPYNLRGAVDGEYRKLYESTGAKSFDMKLGGKKVGTFSVVTTKGTRSVEHVELEVDDEDAFMAWALTNGYFKVDFDAADAHFRQTGEVPPGCHARKVHVPGTPGGAVRSTTLKVDRRAVLDAIGPRLEGVSHALLEGGEEL